MPIQNRIAGFADEMTEWRQWLHRNPELLFDLPKTSAYVADRLREIGVDELHEGVAQTGLVAVIHGRGDGSAIGLRADMDALPINEETGAPYASETPGQMHACGHDGHTTMLLGAAKYLVETRNFSGRAVLFFQPAEEGGRGAEVMVQEGVMERFGIEEVFAVHTSAGLPLGEAKTCVGPLLAMVAEFRIDVQGVGGHGAFPHLTKDPLAAALQLGTALQTIVARNADPMDHVVISTTVLQSGTAHNVIPHTARLGGTVRTLNAETMTLVERRMRSICEGVAVAMDVEVSCSFHADIPATVNHADQTSFAVDVISEVLGSEHVDPACTPLMGGEDFSFMLQARPGNFLFLGQGLGPYVHHPAFDFNDALSPIGASYFARLVERRLPLPS